LWSPTTSTWSDHLCDPDRAGLVATVVPVGGAPTGRRHAGGLGSSLFPGFLVLGVPLQLRLRGAETTSIYRQHVFGLGAIQMAKNPTGSWRAWPRRATCAAGGGPPSWRPSGAAPAPVPVPSASRPWPGDGAPRGGALNGPCQRDPGTGAPARRGAPHLGCGQCRLRDVQVLFGVDLALTQGTITALVGANGAARPPCAGASAADDADVGRDLPGGCRLTAQPAHRRARELLLAQSRGGSSRAQRGGEPDPAPCPPPTSATRPTRGSRSSAAPQDPAGNLSGGEQQMLTMAPVMVRPPRSSSRTSPTLGLAPADRGRDHDRVQGAARPRGDPAHRRRAGQGRLDVADDVALLELGRIGVGRAPARPRRRHATAIYLGQSKVEGPRSGGRLSRGHESGSNVRTTFTTSEHGPVRGLDQLVTGTGTVPSRLVRDLLARIAVRAARGQAARDRRKAVHKSRGGTRGGHVRSDWQSGARNRCWEECGGKDCGDSRGVRRHVAVTTTSPKERRAPSPRYPRARHPPDRWSPPHSM